MTYPVPRSQMRPFSAYVLDTFTLGLRRLPAAAVISVIGWAPAAALLWLLLTRAVTLPSLQGLLGMLDSGLSELPSLVKDPALAVELSVGLAVAYLLGQCVVSGALTHQMFTAAEGDPRNPFASLWRGVCRLHRTVPALLVLAALLAVPFVAGGGAAGWMLWMGEDTWQEPARVGALIFVVVGALILWVWGHLSLWFPAAVLAPRWTFSMGVSFKATGRRWWTVVVRLLLMSLLIAAAVSAVSTPLALLGMTGAELVVTVAFFARVLLSLIASAFSTASAALLYQDTGAPSDLLGDTNS